MTHAVFACFGASFMLLILYLFLDYLSKIFEIYITVMGGITSGFVFQEIMLHTRPIRELFSVGTGQDRTLRQVNIGGDWLCGDVSILNIVGFMLGLGLSFTWYFTFNWLLNNMIAICLSFIFLKTVRLNKLVPGVILLSMLFFYDIFWVFLSPKFTK